MKKNLSKELRIGNILKPDWNEDFIIISAKHIVEQHQADVADVKYLEPIPITIEWLERLGFIDFNHNSRPEFRTIMAWSPGHPSQRFDIDWSKRTGILCKSRYQGDSEDLTMRHIKYIHQLQNLYFALTGEELKIK